MEERDIRLEVVVGAASPPAVTMRAGEPRAIFSVGFEGSWSVAGEGVAAMHAYFVFDGADLFVASIDLSRPATMGGAPVPLSWLQVSVPGEVALGGVVLRTRYVVSHGTTPPPTAHSPESERTQSTAEVAPPPAPPPQRHSTRQTPQTRQTRQTPEKPRLPSRPPPPESERTRFAPVEARAPNAPPSQAVMGGSAAPMLAAPPAIAPPQAPPMPFPPAASPAAAKGPRFWVDASVPKKIIYVLLPLALLSTLYTLRDDDSPAPSRTAPSASASAANATAPSTPTAPAPTPTPTQTAATDAGLTRPPRLPAGKRTLDREVVDLIAAGSYSEAAKRLDALAAAQPDHPEYRETARILRAKAGQSER